MPLLIGLFAATILALAVGTVFGLEPGSDGEPRVGVVAPDDASGDSSSEGLVGDASGAAPQRIGDEPSLLLALGFLGLHISWAALAGVWIWKHRRTIFSPDGALTRRSASSTPWLLLLSAALVWLAIGLGAATSRTLLRLDEGAETTLRGSALIMSGGYAGALIACAFVASLAGPLPRSLGRRPRARDIPRALGAFVLAHPFVWLVGWAGTQIAQMLDSDGPLDPLAHETLRSLAGGTVDAWWLLTVGAALIGAPVVEEILYRGFIQNGLMRLIGSPSLGVAATSLLFAAMHAPSVEPHALPALLILSMAFGVAYLRTGSLLVPIVMHVVFNTANLALALGTA